MIVDGTHEHPCLFQAGVHHIHLITIAKVKGEVRTGGFVIRAQKGQTIPSGARFQVTPILRFPDQAHSEAGVELHRTGNVVDTDGDVA